MVPTALNQDSVLFGYLYYPGDRQLQQGTGAAVTSLPPFSGDSTAHPPRSTQGECNVKWRGGSWGSIQMDVDRHRGLQGQRGTDTSGTQHDYGNGAWASPTPRASRTGVTNMTMASEHGRVILPLGACRSSRYVPIGNAHLGRRSRYQPLPGSGPRS